MRTYILDGKKVIAEPDSKAWGDWFETASRHVADTLIKIQPHTKGPYVDKPPRVENEPIQMRVSTVFLGLDHSFIDRDSDNPLIFETMIFGGKFDAHEYQTRCCTWDEAEAMHMRACKRVIFGEVE